MTSLPPGRFGWLMQRIHTAGDAACLVYKGKTYAYSDLARRRVEWGETLNALGVARGQVIGLRTDYSFDGVALLLALFSNGNVVAMTPSLQADVNLLLREAQAEGAFAFDAEGGWAYQACPRAVEHPLLLSLVNTGEPGFIIFSSGSTGKPKAILHRLEKFLIKFDAADKRLRTLAFLLFDHIAGLDTLFYTLASGGCLVMPERRDAAHICQLMEDHQVEVLPASPTFLKLMCLSGAVEKHNLSHIKIITYGAEPMSQATLERMRQLFPKTNLIQKYGASEFGSPRSRSKGNDSLWLKMGDASSQVKCVDGKLWIKSETAMLGYLNAPSPFDADGWLCTGDTVEVDGEWIKILGRESDIIMVGGEKVFPSEVESVLVQVDDVVEALVYGERHPWTGQIVCAKVNLRQGADPAVVLKNLRRHCRAALAPYKIPMKIEVTDAALVTERQKKVRTLSTDRGGSLSPGGTAERGNKRVLVADVPEQIPKIRSVIEGIADVSAVDTFDGALDELDRPLDLVICGLHFDGSRVLDLQKEAKARAKGVPFILYRGIRGELSESLLDAVKAACRQLGAVESFDIVAMKARETESAAFEMFRQSVCRHLTPA